MKLAPLLRSAQFVWIAANEKWLNIETDDRIQYTESPGWWRGRASDKARHADNRAYGTPDYYYIRKIIRRLRPTTQDVVYDIGAGKGRILCVMSRYSVKKCVGIELFEDFCEVARRNAQRMRGQRCPIEMRCEDAVQTDLSDGTIFFLFNPFGAATMREVLANLKGSLAVNPRRVRIVYYNSVHRSEIETCGWLRQYDHFETFNGLRVDFYQSTT